MEDEIIHEIASHENVDFRENSTEESNSERIENSETVENENLNLVGGAATSRQSPCFQDGQQEVYKLKLTFLSLRSVPKNVLHLKHLKSLDLSHNCLASVPIEFQEFTQLETLNLSYNNLEALPDCFIGSKVFTYLNISHNSFGSVPAALINSMPHLKSLNISFNSIKKFPKPPLCKDRLENLILCSNKLHSIPRWIFDIENLKYVDLSGNFLKKVPRNFLQEQMDIHMNKNIKFLIMRNCQMTNDVLNFASTLLDLDTLDLSNAPDVRENRKNSLHILNQNVIGKMTELKKLIANNIDLHYVHSNIDSLENIRYLDLSCNSLVWLPENFCNLTTLVECKLNKNLLSYLPAEFGKLVNLKKLDLSENNLVHLPESFKSLVNLEKCDLYDNRLKTLDLEIMKIPTLKGIDMEDNCLDFDTLCNGNREGAKELLKSYNILKENYRNDLESECGWMERLNRQNPNKAKKGFRDPDPSHISDFIVKSSANSREVINLTGRMILDDSSNENPRDDGDDDDDDNDDDDDDYNDDENYRNVGAVGGRIYDIFDGYIAQSAPNSENAENADK